MLRGEIMLREATHLWHDQAVVGFGRDGFDVAERKYDFLYADLQSTWKGKEMIFPSLQNFGL